MATSYHCMLHLLNTNEQIEIWIMTPNDYPLNTFYYNYYFCKF
jgi:hypothetical protein